MVYFFIKSLCTIDHIGRLITLLFIDSLHRRYWASHHTPQEQPSAIAFARAQKYTTSSRTRTLTTRLCLHFDDVRFSAAPTPLIRSIRQCPRVVLGFSPHAFDPLHSPMPSSGSIRSLMVQGAFQLQSGHKSLRYPLSNTALTLER